MGIVVIGSTFVDIKGFPQDTYIPDGRNVGRIEYVHGGVAFFGGGKNYGVFEQINSEKSFASLNGYQITLAQAGRTELQLAAGEEPFYFLMHDKTTINFTPKIQDELLSSEEGYAFVYVR